MKYNVDEIQKNMHIRQVEGIGDRLEEDIRNILNRAGIYFRIFSRAKTPFSIAQKNRGMDLGNTTRRCRI